MFPAFLQCLGTKIPWPNWAQLGHHRVFSKNTTRRLCGLRQVQNTLHALQHVAWAGTQEGMTKGLCYCTSARFAPTKMNYMILVLEDAPPYQRFLFQVPREMLEKKVSFSYSNMTCWKIPLFRSMISPFKKKPPCWFVDFPAKSNPWCCTASLPLHSKQPERVVLRRFLH